jgi:hypothetical protein
VSEYSEYPCRYIPKDNRLYLIDKEHSIVSFQVRIVRIGYGEWKMRAWMMEIRVRMMEIRVRMMEIRVRMMEIGERMLRNAARPPRVSTRAAPAVDPRVQDGGRAARVLKRGTVSTHKGYCEYRGYCECSQGVL